MVCVENARFGEDFLEAHSHSQSAAAVLQSGIASDTCQLSMTWLLAKSQA